MMRAASGALLLSLAAVSVAEDARVAGMVFEGASLRLGVDRIQSLEFDASGSYYQFGQAPAPELPWPEFEVDGYVATLDFARAAIHAKYHRVQVQQPGRARPYSEQTMDQFARDGMTWNLTPGPTAIPANLAERNAELWASPQGFIKAAIAHHAKVKRLADGRTLVSYSVGKYPYEGELNAVYDVMRVGTIMDSAVLGDTPIEFRYSEYRDFDGVRFPVFIERRVAGLPWYKLTVSDLRINQAPVFEVPAQIAADPAPSMAAIEISELAPGVLLFGGGSHNSVIVEQRGGIVVIEAPLSGQRSEAVMAAVRERFPGRRITAVINTHAHFDHAGGLRAYAAAGVPVVTHARNATYYRRAWAAPRTLNPDGLAKSRHQPKFRPFTGKLLLDDPLHPIELHEIVGSGHNDAFAMVYLPKERLLVEADAWTPTPPGAKPPTAVNPLWLNLRDNIQRLGLDVQRFAPLHGAPQSQAEFSAALGQPE
jgi:glyoxylase-like metal-dependent hydrolase (beta-lactamase superfamily II)